MDNPSFVQKFRQMRALAQRMIKASDAEVAIIAFPEHGPALEFASPSLREVLELLHYEPRPTPAVLLDRISALDLQQLTAEELIHLKKVVNRVLLQVRRELKNRRL